MKNKHTLKYRYISKQHASNVETLVGCTCRKKDPSIRITGFVLAAGQNIDTNEGVRGSQVVIGSSLPSARFSCVLSSIEKVEYSKHSDCAWCSTPHRHLIKSRGESARERFRFFEDGFFAGISVPAADFGVPSLLLSTLLLSPSREPSGCTSEALDWGGGGRE